jgi:hypothetical protein
LEKIENKTRGEQLVDNLEKKLKTRGEQFIT